MQFKVFPDVEGGLTVPDWEKAEISEETDNLFKVYSIKLEEKKLELDVKIDKNRAVLNLHENSFNGVEDIFLRINYMGDVGNAFIDGRLINDNFYNGTPWEIGLKRFNPEILEKGMYFYIKPLEKGEYITTDSAMALKQDFIGEKIACIDSIEAVPEYRVMVVKKSCF